MVKTYVAVLGLILGIIIGSGITVIAANYYLPVYCINYGVQKLDTAKDMWDKFKK